MMLAFYLAIPEVENDRRGLNIRQGIRKAKEQGKWVGPAPLGYKNNCSPDGIKSLVQNEPDASILRRAFEQVASFTYSISDAYRNAIKSGLNCSLSNFFRILRSPVYAGSIIIKDTSKSEALVVPGMHIGITTPAIFEKVQQVARNKTTTNDIQLSSNFPLRGFIKCPVCQKTLTASASSSASQRKYYYYHCISSCGYRIGTNKVIQVFLKKLETLKPVDEHIDSYKRIVEDFYQNETRKILSQKIKAIQAIDQFTQRIAKAKNLLLDGYINFTAFEEIETDSKTKIAILGDTVSFCSKKQIEFTNKVNNSAWFLSEMDVFFSGLNEQNKRSFLNNVLIRATVWDHENLDQIFHPSFRKIYKSLAIPEDDQINALQVRTMLEVLMNIELSSNNSNQ